MIDSRLQVLRMGNDDCGRGLSIEIALGEWHAVSVRARGLPIDDAGGTSS
jgi:hypothetical protein